jgi:hypothetical protein
MIRSRGLPSPVSRRVGVSSCRLMRDASRSSQARRWPRRQQGVEAHRSPPNLAHPLRLERQQRHVPGPFNRSCQDALMLGACPRFTSRANLALLRDVSLENLGLLIVEGLDFLSAELAQPRSANEAPSAARSSAGIALPSLVFCQDIHSLPASIPRWGIRTGSLLLHWGKRCSSYSNPRAHPRA